MRRRTLSSTDVTYEPIPVVFVNNVTNLIVIETEELDTTKYPVSEWTPIGLVVVPAEHGVLKDGTGTVNQCGIMSLVDMSRETPENGWDGESFANNMAWGGYHNDLKGYSDGLDRYDSTDSGLRNYTCVAETNNSSSNEARGLSDEYVAYLPIQQSVGSIPTRDKSPYAPSPYIGSDYKSGGYNESYSYNPWYAEANALSDFKGIVNTKILTDCSLISAYVEDWRTATTIKNSVGSSYYFPAACCCGRFKTPGTKAFKDCTIDELRNGVGFWYLPACGEMGYIHPRFADIQDTLKKINNAYGVGHPLIIDSGSNYPLDYWTSTEYDDDAARTIKSNESRTIRVDGSIGLSPKVNYAYVRAFMRL